MTRASVRSTALPGATDRPAGDAFMKLLRARDWSGELG